MSRPLTASQVPSPASPETDGLSIWPRSTRPGLSGDVTVAGVSLAEAAARFGGPVYVLDEEEVRERCRTTARTLVRRESLDDMNRRDIGL
ncbi:hypothetical protein [Streptomyces sp. E-08]|uniref:hypothetical protein n=1 Tax=Streptomyces sp. E-08 TaxID=3404047 RepID=UPI003CEF4FB4